MFVPMAEGLMVDIAESEAVIDSLMEQLPSLFQETRETETILGPVIQVGQLSENLLFDLGLGWIWIFGRVLDNPDYELQSCRVLMFLLIRESGDRVVRGGSNFDRFSYSYF